MQSGKLRHFVEYQRSTVTRDSHGDQVKAWATVADGWADVLPLSGREFIQAAQVLSDVNIEVRARAVPGLTLTPADRIKYGSRVFDIRHVIDWQGRGAEWRFLCTERF